MTVPKSKPKPKKIGMKKSVKRQQIKLDAEEQDLLASYKRGEWKTVKNLAEEKTFAKKAAANYSRKDTRINIRLSSTDLELIKQRAVYEGLPYQTLAASVLHKYAAGHLT